MKARLINLKKKLAGGGGTTSGVLSGIGSLYPVCHSLCMSVVSLLAVIGITVNVLPLMFLQTYQSYFWGAALLFTSVSLYLYLQQKQKVPRDKNLLFINSGLLIFGLPFSALAGYMDLFRFSGGALALAGLFLLIFGNAPATVTFKLPKFKLSSALFTLVISSFLLNQYFMWRMNNASSSDSGGTMEGSLSRMKFTVFDVAMAKERMDKNNDGICDICGMPIQQCLDSGQMDCSMGNNPSAIGILGTQHIHADWKLYIDGQPFDWTPYADLHERQMKGDASVNNTSAFMHIHPVNAPEKAGDVLHMHAKNVPLSIFFRSLGMNLMKDSLTLADGLTLKNEKGNTLKFYVNGKKVDALADYVFQPLDKLLISYGPKNDPDLTRQINSITNFAKDH